MDIAAWLEGLGLGQYGQAFRDNEVDERVLPSLTAEDLKDLGVMLVGHRRRLLDGIAALGTSARVAAATARTEFLKHPYRALRDKRPIVIEHRPRRPAYAGDVVPVGLVHDVRNGRDVGSCRSSDAKCVYHQSLRNHPDGRAHRPRDALVVERIDGILPSVGTRHESPANGAA
jgi:SAM (Sterile alpha motif) domain-containing protein